MAAVRNVHLASPVSSPSTSSEDLRIAAPKSYKRQFMAAFIACIGPMAMGSVIGYTSPAVPDMERDAKFVALNADEESLIGSLMTVGAVVGGLGAGFLTDYFGRKLFIMLTCIPYSLGWLLIICAQNLWMILAGRFVTGVCVGMTCLGLPLYLTEISSPQIRGVLGASFQLFINIGIVAAFILGKYLRWNYLALVLAFIPAMQLVLLVPLPESPSWLLRQRRRPDALESLAWLRGAEADVVAECAHLELDQSHETKMVLRDFTRPLLLRPLCLMLLEMGIQQLSGINAVIFNAVSIFARASESLDSHDAAIIVGGCMTGATAVAFFLMDKAGRRILLLASSVLMGLSMGALGTFYLIQDNNDIWWLPVLSVVIFVISFNLGFGPVPWLMMSEVFPSQASGLASSIVTAFAWGLAFVVTKTFVNLQTALGTHGAFWLYGSVAMSGTVLVYLFVPETKGKTLDEIRQHFVPGHSIVGHQA